MKIPRREEFIFFQSQVPITHEKFLSEFHSSIDGRDRISLTEKSVLVNYDSREGFSHFYIKNSGLL